MIGKIKKLVSDKGFGFIKGDDNKDYFFHRSQVPVFEHLMERQKVSFDATMKNGKDRAENIKCI